MGQTRDNTKHCSCRSELQIDPAVCQGCGQQWCGYVDHFGAHLSASATLDILDDLADSEDDLMFCCYSCKADSDIDNLYGPLTVAQAIHYARAA